MISFKRFYESIENIKIWYHGTKIAFDSFDYKYVIKEESNAQYGPGFYLSDSMDVAKDYSGEEGYIKRIVLTNYKNIKTQKTKYGSGLVDRLIRNIPDKNIIYDNWGKNKIDAINNFKKTMITYNPTLLELVQSMRCDGYKKHESLFCETLKNMKIDGFIIPQQNGVNFLVCYNPEILKTVEMIKI